MGKARSIQTGDETAGARVEYVKSRRVIRVSGWHQGDQEISPVELSTSKFLSDLGIGTDEVGADPVYLLLAGLQDHQRGPIRHVTAAFPSELEARHVFRRLRTEHQLPDEWAQVVTLDARCRLVPLCWFGTPGELVTGSSVGTPRPEPATPADAPARARRWGPRRSRP